MSKDISIEHTVIRVPTKIIIDGVNYPIHSWNINVIQEFWSTGDESVLNKLKDFSLAI